MPRPRRRPSRAPRLSRMDAAVDAMRPYGFPEKRVKKCVKELLKEYGGDEGWPFIEDSSYSVLLNSLLEENDDDGQAVENGNLLEGTPSENQTSHDMVPSNICNDPVSSAGYISTGEAADGGLPAQSPPLDSMDLVAPANKRRRFPCYGWIESDEDEDDADDFIVLGAPLTEKIGGRAIMEVSSWRKKRRSRWDVKPVDPS